MIVLDVLYNLIIGPLQLLFEFIFSISYKLVGDPGVCIIDLSIIMNLLALPLYKRADLLQKQAADKMKAIQPWQDRIRKTFKGDERFMMLQAYNREKGVRPSDALKGSISLLLEIPFFIAAFRMLSSLELLNGKSFGPISDLGSPDGLIAIGAVSVNLLPILMTAINLVSSSIYLKDSDIKGKIQLYGIAAIFLVLLYNSPAGLVFYWTCNNIFSLVKNILMSGRPEKNIGDAGGTDPSVFVSCCAYIAVFTGLFIPSNMLRSSPSEFTDMHCFTDPSVFLIYSLSLAAGTFILWCGVYYYLSDRRGRKIMESVFSVLAVVFTVNYFALGDRYGQFTKRLQYSYPDMHITNCLLEAIVLLIITSGAVFLIFRFNKKVFFYLAVSAAALALIFGILYTVNIKKQIRTFDYMKDEQEYATITLSRTGKNVIIIMADRAQGYLVPYIFNDIDGLYESFDGFTYYPNTVSFGAHTNFAAPALFGGYEYTPDALNARGDESIASKHDEALKVLPVLFLENGYNVTLCDLPYAGYQEVPDLSIFSDYPQIDTYITNGRYNELKEEEVAENNTILKRNIFCYSIFRIMPVCLQGIFYDNAHYNCPDYRNDWTFIPRYKADGSGITGYDAEFLDSYTVLDNLPDMTVITDDPTGTLTEMENNTPHSTAILSEPDYIPMYQVDNTEYDMANMERFTVDDVTLSMEIYLQYSSYEVNAACYIKLAEWFDYLREQGVYDNTRIIVVSDHGYDFGMLPSWADGEFSAEFYNPVLLVKDFDAHGFETSDVFMTNADTPSIALEGLVDDPVNPFTGNPVDNTYKDGGEIMVFASHEFFISSNNGNTFLPDSWYTVHDDVRYIDNWEYEGVW